nr:alpha/beta hydrolase [Thioalkalivibrio sp.]
MFRLILFALFMTALVFLLAACGRIQSQPAGPPVQEPVLSDREAVMADGYVLPIQRWETHEPTADVILGVHGFGDHGGAFAVLSEALVAPGLATIYAYDQRGFGATRQSGIWPGGDTLVGDLRSVTDLLRVRYPERSLYLIAESMGGAVALRALTETPGLDVDGAVLLAPAVWGADTMPWYQRLGLWIMLRIAPGAAVPGEAADWLGFRATDDREVMEALNEDPLVYRTARVDMLRGLTRLMGEALLHPHRLDDSVLVLYGLKDHVIPPGPVCAWWERLAEEAGDARPRIALYPEGYHMLTRYLGADDTLSDIASWIDDPEAELPAGEGLPLEAARDRVCALPPRGDWTGP